MGREFAPRLEQDSGGEVVSALRALQAGRMLTLVGIEAAAIRLPYGVPLLLRLDVTGVIGHTAAIARVLDDLAALALAAWPVWPNAKLSSWGRAAGRLAVAGRTPRFRSLAAELQFPELLAAAGAPILMFPLDPLRPERAAPLIAALEWCCRHGAAAVAVLAEPPLPRPPWDRVLHGALNVHPVPEPPSVRLVPPLPLPKSATGSAVERRMRAALAADRELANLFDDEVTLSLGPLGPTPRVDLLWREGKIVVELDGTEHERNPTYAADRHRDYELLVAGYLVLRLTNAEVELDLARALDKVRRVVALRRPAA